MSFSNDQKRVEEFDYEGVDLEAMTQAGNYYAWIADIIKPYLGKNIVEVGAGVGSFSKLLKAAGPETLTAIEPSKRTYEHLKANVVSTKKTKVTTINSYFTGQETKLKNNVDTFVYINVFEHIKDDRTELKRIASTLQKGGYAIIFVPALKGLYSEFDKSIGHYRRYDKKRLQDLAEAAGMDVVQLRYMDMLGMAPWWFSFVLLRRKKLMPQAIKIYDKLAVPLVRLLESVLEPPLGKNILLVAKKR